jgi:ribose transport system ATP-binding protein
VINTDLHMGAQLASPFLVTRAIAKSFGGAQALKDVSLEIAEGEVHGLAGANGAGKSTFIKILAGLQRPDSGVIEIDGRSVSIDTPQMATDLGMSFIHQELAFIPGMNVMQNIMLGLPKPSHFGLIDWKAVARDLAPIVKRVGITAPLNANVKGLSTAEKWLINICRALVRKARLIVMDEPTASLSSAECEKLFEIIRDLPSHGVAVLYVSHRLDELLKLCQRVTVFRDGNRVAELLPPSLSRKTLVEAIVGSAVTSDAKRPQKFTERDIVLKVENLTRSPRVHDVSLEMYRGEVLGIAGLVGAGRTELARLLYGADRSESGRMTLSGKPYNPRSPAAAVAKGVGLVPEERRSEGLVLSKSIAFNLSLANLHKLVISRYLPLLSQSAQATLATETMLALSIKAPGIKTPVGKLSGGNQQKVVIGRWLQHVPKILILDEPTRGVEVGSRAEIHRLIRGLAEKGMAVLVISSEPDELPDICDRVLVMAEGKLVSELAGNAVTRNAIVEASYTATETSTRTASQ